MNAARRRDLQLAEAISARDPAAAKQLFDRHADEIFGYLVRRVGPQPARDLLQEIFERALRGASRYRGDSSLRTWLYGIARHVVGEVRRDRLEPDWDLSPADLAPRAESLLIAAESRRQLIWALERLPDEQAIVVELCRLDGLSHERVGEILGVRPATSRKRLERALGTLRGMLRSRDVARCPRHGGLESWARSLRGRVLSSGSWS